MEEAEANMMHFFMRGKKPPASVFEVLDEIWHALKNANGEALDEAKEHIQNAISLADQVSLVQEHAGAQRQAATGTKEGIKARLTKALGLLETDPEGAERELTQAMEEAEANMMHFFMRGKKPPASVFEVLDEIWRALKNANGEALDEAKEHIQKAISLADHVSLVQQHAGVQREAATGTKEHIRK